MNLSEPKTVAETILAQINKGVLMSLGASNLGYSAKALTFNARILPMTKAGRGARARVMAVRVELGPDDTYSVQVAYPKRGAREVHFKESGVYADQLNRVLLALDFDGEQVSNPRYWP